MSAYDTKLPDADFRSVSYRNKMRMASRDLKIAIERGEINPSKFTVEEVKRINAGSYKIPNYTWHHHQDLGRMQLVPTNKHNPTGHIGGEAISKG
ncbi:HNH endonuclease [Klebsiella aerogenes]|uniref:HNH endonuclease n=1 Tax=Klebsiella aerogenes TaxID=548 RepID=UPI0039841D7D